MTKKKIERRLDHNQNAPHRDRMAKRITLRDNRIPTVRKVKQGFYTPRVEDEKHQGWIASLKKLVGME